uniref:Carn_acyltransf domain-containing protein n=1 Tax=Syphacia muris TaxID=451379 RepID=A0A0N5ADW2_9BILA
MLISLTLFSALHLDLSLGIIPFFQYYIFAVIDGIISCLLSLIVCGTLIWFVAIQFFRLSLKALLSYKGWMYEKPHLRRISLSSKLWLVKLISRCRPMLHSFQGALPHLRSLRPLYTDDKFKKLTVLSEKFRRGVGRSRQRDLFVKWILSVNYVTDWWEEFVYLRQRLPIMISSNYYGFDSLLTQATKNQAAPAANVTWIAFQFRRMVERQEVTPFSLSPFQKVPFCTIQYERIFNSCRIQGEDTDRFLHWDDTRYIVNFDIMILSGCICFFLCILFILDGNFTPIEGEVKLAALTAGDRKLWTLVRNKFFSSGTQKTESVGPHLLHGSGTNRWFDKSINFIVYKNGRFGANAEHSCDIYKQGYDKNGNALGIITCAAKPERLKWVIDEELQVSLNTAKLLIDDVEVCIEVDEFIAFSALIVYIVKRYLEEESPFLDKVFPPTYMLSTSQTSLNQAAEQSKDLLESQRLSLLSADGGFGPVADKGCGASYIVAGESQITFHVSSKKSAENTSSFKFCDDISESLREMYDLVL